MNAFMDFCHSQESKYIETVPSTVYKKKIREKIGRWNRWDDREMEG